MILEDKLAWVMIAVAAFSVIAGVATYADAVRPLDPRDYPEVFPAFTYHDAKQQLTRDYVAEHGQLMQPEEFDNFSLDMPEKVICGWIPVIGRVPADGITVITISNDDYIKYWNLSSDSSKELRGYIDISCEWPEATYDLKYHWMGKTNLQVENDGLTRPHLDIEQKLTVYHP